MANGSSDLVDLPQGSTVYRLVNHTPLHFPPGADKPTRQAFALTSDDKAEGERRGRPPFFRSSTSSGLPLPKAATFEDSPAS